MSADNIKFKIKKDRADIERRDDFLANRMTVILIAATALIITMLLLKRNNNHFEAQFILYVLPFLRPVLGLAFVAALIYRTTIKIKKTDDSMRFFGSAFMLGIASLLFGLSLIFTYVLVMGSVICLIGATLLYFINCFYQRDFFWFTVITAAGAMLFYIGSLEASSVISKNIVKTAARYLSIILPVIFIIAVVLLKRWGGYIIRGGKRAKIMKQEYNYYPFITSAAITLAGAVAARLFPGAVIYFMIILLIAYLLVAIIYTVKMI